jgi:hypothetical protein
MGERRKQRSVLDAEVICLFNGRSGRFSPFASPRPHSASKDFAFELANGLPCIFNLAVQP